MRWVLFILSALVFIDGMFAYTGAETIMQQIAGIMILVLSGILFTGAAVVDAVVNLKQEIRKITSSAKNPVKREEDIIAANNKFLADQISVPAQINSDLKQSTEAVVDDSGNKLSLLIFSFVALFIIVLTLLLIFYWKSDGTFLTK